MASDKPYNPELFDFDYSESEVAGRFINLGTDITLLDLFALKAMEHYIKQSPTTQAAVAEASYWMADAMLAEREKRNG